MALYQPSFMVPHNQTIDVTNEQDMIFSFKLNGNHPLVAYNIQIFDNNDNSLVYELIDSTNIREMREQLNTYCNYIENQTEKRDTLSEAIEAYNTSELLQNFKSGINNIMGNAVGTTNKDSNINLLDTMSKILAKKKEGKTLTESEVSDFFASWKRIIQNTSDGVGSKDTGSSGGTTTHYSGYYVMEQLEKWSDIDPKSVDSIIFDEDVEIPYVDWTEFNKAKSIFDSLCSTAQNTFDVIQSQGMASGKTYITDTSYDNAKKIAYILYSNASSLPYFSRDIYSAVTSAWSKQSSEFDKIGKDIEDFYAQLEAKAMGVETALAHIDNGGYTLEDINLYDTASPNIILTIPKGTDICMLGTSGNDWITSYKGVKGLIKQQDYLDTKKFKMYDIPKDKYKYYLETPVYPTNSEGEQNTISYTIPSGRLENGKDYKWSATLYWNASGQYRDDNMITGSITSVENFFQTRKRPVVGIKNYNQIFTIPFNFVKMKNEVTFVQEDGTSVTIEVGSNVRIINVNKESSDIVDIEYIEPKTNQIYQEQVSISDLEGLGLYGTSTDYILPSKKAEFIGLYEQEQYSSVAYFRWILYKLHNDTEEISEVVKDTGMVPSADLRFFYEGFLNGEKYAIKMFVQTVDNVEAETDLIKFKVSYITYPIENMLNGENSPIEHGIIVEWSNLKLINGQISGGYEYQDNIPTTNKTSLTLEKDAELIFDKDKNKPMSLDFDANQILCTRFDEDRPTEIQTVYLASGLDDNGEVITKSLQIIPHDDIQETGKATLSYVIQTANETQVYEQEIISNPLYWYVIIMKSDGFIVYTKYAQGLFPAIDQFPQRNKFTGADGLYPDALTYLEVPSDRVVYDFQTIVDRDGNEIKNGGGNS